MPLLQSLTSHLAIKLAVSSIGFFLPYYAVAQTKLINNPTISAVLDGYYQTEDRAFSEREKGFGLGETELAFSASIDDMFFGKVTSVFTADKQNTEVELEEAFIQTLTLPAGLSFRGGRFLSDIGYLNEQHLHTDHFVERPLAYRAFLGGHYFDDGMRLSYVFPTSVYWQVAIEAFSGNKLRAEDEHNERDFSTLGVYTFNTKFGGDLGTDHSWQLGLSYLRNENGRLTPHDEDEQSTEHDAHGDEQAGHSHNAAFTGENTFSTDLVYKWAPQGNYKYQHLTVSAEYFQVLDILPKNENGPYDDYNAWYLSGVYQLSPQWTAGIRYGELTSFTEEHEQFEQQKRKETDFMIAWHHSHFSTVRLQYSMQSDSLANIPKNIVTLQYVMSLGAHNAHQF